MRYRLRQPVRHPRQIRSPPLTAAVAPGENAIPANHGATAVRNVTETNLSLPRASAGRFFTAACFDQSRFEQAVHRLLGKAGFKIHGGKCFETPRSSAPRSGSFPMGKPLAFTPGLPNISTKIASAIWSSLANASRRFARSVPAWPRIAAMRRCSGSGGNGAGSSLRTCADMRCHARGNPRHHIRQERHPVPPPQALSPQTRC